MSCAVNGTSGREAGRPLSRASRRRRVLVVGGGCAGLEAARVAALRGHEVVLCERHGHLGGSLLLAATVHAENEPLLDFLVGEVRRLGVEVRLGCAVTVGAATALPIAPVFMAIIELRFIRQEEAMLQELFPEEFPDYCRRVRRWI